MKSIYISVDETYSGVGNNEKHHIEIMTFHGGKYYEHGSTT